MEKLCTVIFLGFNSWKDVRHRQISLAAAFVFAVAALGNTVWKGELDIWYFLPAGIGVGLLAVSIATGGALGMGDCWIIAALGLMLAPEEFFLTLCIALFLSAVWAAVLLFVFRKDRKTAFPFVPFLLLGYLGGLCL